MAPTAIAFLLPLALYLSTATRTLQGGDTAEFALVGAVGGVPHPPGYPLYAVLARLAVATLPGPPAGSVAVVSAVCAAAAVAVLFAALLRLTGNRIAAFASALLFTVSPVQWKMAGVPEVFALASLGAAATLLAAARLAASDSASERARALAAGVTFGLSLACHATLVLLLPLVVWAVLAAPRTRAWRPTARRIAWVGLGLGAGLLAYLYLPLAASLAGDDAWIWGEPDRLGGLFRHLLRADYGTFRLAPSDRGADAGAQVAAVLGSLGPAFLWIPCAVGLGGMFVGYRRQPDAFAALLVAFALAGVALPSRFNLPETAIAAEVAERFRLLPHLLFAVPVAFGAAWIHERIGVVAAPALLLAPLAALPRGWAGADWRSDPTIERYFAAAIEALPDGAVVLCQGDPCLPGVRYVSRVVGHRQVDVVDVHLLRLRWYHDRTARQIPELADLPFDAERTPLKTIATRVAERRPTYANLLVAMQLIGVVPTQPEGLLFRVLAEGADPAPPNAIEASVFRATQRLGPLPSRPVDAWSAAFRESAALSWRAVASRWERSGDPERAAAARARADTLSPNRR